MGELSQYPETRSDRPFPIGDIPRDARFDHAMRLLRRFDTIPYRDDRANAYYGSIVAEQRNMRSTLDIIEDNTGRPARARYAMVDRALNLCDMWDTDINTGAYAERVSIGFIAAHSLAIRTRILPYFYKDYSSTLKEMRYGGREYARFFGAAAWANMARSHKTLLEVHEALNGLMKQTFYDREEDEDFYKAGMMLAYNLAAHTAMDDQTPRPEPGQ